jgi:hypothetical protein
MATANLKLINTLRKTAGRLRSTSDFRWTHMGRCICGHLAQTITSLTPAEIHAMALQKAGDWGRQSIEYCPASGYTIDHIIESMLSLGLDRYDIASLEKLGDNRILRRLGVTHLDYRSAPDAARYLSEFANMLEEDLLENEVPDIKRISELLGNMVAAEVNV